ncbi:MAG: serine/threonine protein kinase, partial [Planctomycetota bacterium]
MADESFAKVREIFEAAYVMPPEDRGAYLSRACGEDPELRARVETLLAAAEEEHPFLSDPTAAPTAENAPGFDARTTPSEATGSTIGRYKLREKIGEGGFGVVYMADQDHPVRRRVALKIIKPGMDSKQVIARFEAERQALAMMDHPCIARVLDAGETDLGHPYFVMELVRGEPITEYCVRNRLSTRERLELFTQVCRAVQHAHQKGVIHRDIKPSNVLITVADGNPMPKVIDFGIAKATGGRLTDLTLFTERHALIGTPAYMSPEQAEMSAVDIDTRSDIYALGVLLYELLTGTTPFDTKELMAAGLGEIQRIIREREPEKPSTRLSTLTRTPADDARRPEDPDRLSSIVRGDLDWIVMKSLEKDRTRRYETADGLAADVARHLAGEAVLAAPPSAAYRVRKFIRRHRVGVTASSLVVLALLAGAVGTTIGLVRAERQRALAEERARETQQVADFQMQMLTDMQIYDMGRTILDELRHQVEESRRRRHVGELLESRPRTPEEIDADLAAFDDLVEGGVGVDVARRVLDDFVLSRTADSIETQFADQPLVAARLHFGVGTMYQSLGMHDDAEPHLQTAVDIRRQELGDDDPWTLAAISELGHALKAIGLLDDAIPLCLEAMERSRRVLGDDDPSTMRRINNLGLALTEHGRYDAAEPYCVEAVGRRRRVLGDDDPATLTSIGNLGTLRYQQGQLPEAETLRREGLEGSRGTLGDDAPRTWAWL